MAMIHVVIFWVIILCSYMGGYQHLEGLCCLPLHVGILSHHCVVL